MFNMIYKLLLVTPLLSGCVAIDYTIPLDSEFEVNSEYLLIPPPIWRIPDSVYDRKLSNYSIENAQTSSKSIDKDMTGIHRKYNIIGHLFLEQDFSNEFKEFKVHNSINYNFDLTKDKLLIATTQCESLSFSIFEEKYDENYSFSSADYKDRLKTYLACTINHNGIIWKMTLRASKGNEFDLQLKNKHQFYNVKKVSQISILREGEKSTIPDENNIISQGLGREQISGLEFFKNSKQVTALSFAGKSKIWLNKNLSEDSRSLLLAVNYSLAMFDWLDPKWQ